MTTTVNYLKEIDPDFKIEDIRGLLESFIQVDKKIHGELHEHHVFKLRAFSFSPGVGRVKLFGEGDFFVEGTVKTLAISRLYQS